MATHDDPIPYWRRLAGTLGALLAVLGVLAVIITVLGGLAARRAAALLETPATQPTISPVTRPAAASTRPAGITGPVTLPERPMPPAVAALPAVLPIAEPRPAVKAPEVQRPPEQPQVRDRNPAIEAPQRPRIPDAPQARAGRPADQDERRRDADQAKVETIMLDSPRGEFTIPTVTFGRRVVVKGRIKSLLITAVTAGGSIDATELEVQDVRVRGAIDGGSTVRLRATEKVKFSGPIDGRSKVEISVPNGKADFATDRSVEGGSRVTIAARDIEFHGMVAGERTDIAVAVSDGGSLRFAKMDGTSRIRYGKANPADSAPAIKKGKILGRAQFGTFEEVE